MSMFETCVYRSFCATSNGSEEICQGVKYGLEPCKWYAPITERSKEDEKE